MGLRDYWSFGKFEVQTNLCPDSNKKVCQADWSREVKRSVMIDAADRGELFAANLRFGIEAEMPEANRIWRGSDQTGATLLGNAVLACIIVVGPEGAKMIYTCFAFLDAEGGVYERVGTLLLLEEIRQKSALRTTRSVHAGSSQCSFRDHQACRCRKD